MSYEDKLQIVSDLTKNCLLPELPHEIGVEQITSEHFKQFKTALNTNLHLLFDIIQQNETDLFQLIDANQLFHVDFVMLLCEQMAAKTLFQTDQPLLHQYLTILFEKYFLKLLQSDEVLHKALGVYKVKLKANTWKKNIGTVHGFIQFCEIYYNDHGAVLNLNEAIFQLSVGTLLIEYFEPLYKELGIHLFIILLNCADKNDILSSNIHDAIYASCFPTTSLIKNETHHIKLWTCLLKCIELNNCPTNPSTWNKIDDVLATLLKKIPFESDGRIVAILFIFIAKLVTVHCTDKQYIEMQTDLNVIQHNINKSYIENNLSEFFNLNQLQMDGRLCENYSIYRWIKRLMSLLANHMICILSPEETLFQIYALHLCFVCCIFNVSTWKLIKIQIVEFYNKFPPILLNTFRHFQHDRPIRCAIVSFLDTLIMHSLKAKMSDNTDDCVTMLKNRCETLLTIKQAMCH